MKIAYLASRYPAISHTFIMREILALREAGFDVRTFTVRRVPNGELLTELDRREARNTRAILPAGFFRIFTAHASMLLHSPARYFSTLCNALSRRPAGMRQLIWHLFYFVEAGLLAHRLRQSGVTHIHAHFANVAANVAKLAAQLSGGTWSLTIHGHADYGDPTTSRLADKIASAAFTVCVSDFGKAQAMLQTNPALWPRIHRVFCGIDTKRFQPAVQSAKKQSSSLRLLTVARLSPEKGLTVLLDALSMARTQGADVHLTIVGYGPLQQALQQQTDRLQLNSCVTFAGAIGQDRIQSFYQNADAFVLSSFSEGLPVVLMEAMATGLPVIASRITGIPELVRENTDGLLVPPGNVSVLADAICTLARNPELCAQYAASARDQVCRHFDSKVTLLPLISLFQSQLVQRLNGTCLLPAACCLLPLASFLLPLTCCLRAFPR